MEHGQQRLLRTAGIFEGTFMEYKIEDYTFASLLHNGPAVETPVNTLAYLISLVDGPGNSVIDLQIARRFLGWLYDVEEQVRGPTELLLRQGSAAGLCPNGLYPQTPVMLTKEWSPVSAMLENGLEPLALTRMDKRRACASGIWEISRIPDSKCLDECRTAEELFWHVFRKISDKAKARNLLVSIIAKPGWSYDHDVHINTLRNMTSKEAERADRVIWQRTPRPG
jgi:hypothetical protein